MDADIGGLVQAGQLVQAAERSMSLLHGQLPLSAAALDRVICVATCLQRSCSEAAQAPEGVVRFLEAAIRATSTSSGSAFSSDPVGDPRLHEALAAVHASGRDFVKSQRHMLRANAPAAFAQMLANWAVHAAPSEGELLLCRAALCTLCVASTLLERPPGSHIAGAAGVTSARALLAELSALHRSERSKLDPEAPLAHFADFAVLALERRAPALLAWLQAQYSERLKCDPGLVKYVSVIQQRLSLELAALPAGLRVAGAAPPAAGDAPAESSTIEDMD